MRASQEVQIRKCLRQSCILINRAEFIHPAQNTKLFTIIRFLFWRSMSTLIIELYEYKYFLLLFEDRLREFIADMNAKNLSYGVHLFVRVTMFLLQFTFSVRPTN